MPSLSSTTESVFEPTTSSAAHLPSIAVSFTPSSAISTASRSIIKTTLSTMTENLNLPPTTPPRMNPTTAGFANIATTSSSSSIPTIMSSSGTEKIIHVAELSSSLQHFGFVDYFVFVLMLVVCAVIGIYFGFVEKKKKNNRTAEKRRGSEALDYLVGSRKMQVIPVALSLVASFVSGISLLGTSTEIYVYGTQYAFILLTLAISGIISWYVFLPVFCNLQLTSTYEYFEKRFDRRIRLFGSVLFMFSSMLWLPISVYVPALTFNQVTGINLHIITPVVCGVCTIYTCFGGLKAVVWTDVIQSFVIFGSIAFVMIEGTIRVGGLDVVWQRNMDTGRLSAPEMTLDPTVRMSVLSVFIGGTIFKLQHTAISQPVVQRFLSLPSLDKVKQTLIIFTVGLVTVLSSCVYMGLLTFATYYDCDPLSTKLTSRSDQLVPLLVMQVLGKFPGVPGLFVSGVFSAALSSLSTCLNSMAAVILEDFFKPFSRKPLTERHTAFILRAVVIVFGAFSIVMVYVVEKMGMVLQLSATLQSMTQGPLLGIFTVGMLLPWVSSKSILVGSTTALAIMGWISYKSQVAIITGELTFPKMPVSVEGCTYNYETIPILNSTVYEAPDPGSSKPIYHMSFLWYTLFGVVITIVASGVASLFYGLQDASEIDEILIAPPIRRFIKLYRYDSVDLVEKKVGAYETKKYYDHEKDVNEEGTKCPKEKF